MFKPVFFQCIRLIRKFSPGSKIIGLSGYTLPAYAKKMIKMGGRGYMTKCSSTEEVLQAIDEVVKGHQYIFEHIKHLLDADKHVPASLSFRTTLSSREIEIISLVKKGLTSRQIGESLGISLKTTEVHRHRIFKKLNVRNIAELIHYSNSSGL